MTIIYATVGVLTSAAVGSRGGTASGEDGLREAKDGKGVGKVEESGGGETLGAKDSFNEGGGEEAQVGAKRETAKDGAVCATGHSAAEEELGRDGDESVEEGAAKPDGQEGALSDEGARSHRHLQQERRQRAAHGQPQQRLTVALVGGTGLAKCLRESRSLVGDYERKTEQYLWMRLLEGCSCLQERQRIR